MTFDNSAAKFTLTEKQFAAAVGLSPQLIAQLRKQGRIPHVKVNSRILYLRTDVDRFIAQHRQASAEVVA
jgi:transcriptional regulator with XRE-family HTH domain